MVRNNNKRNKKNKEEVATQEAKPFEQLCDHTAYMGDPPESLRSVIEKTLTDHIDDEFAVVIEGYRFDSLRMMRVLLFKLYLHANFTGEENFAFCMSVPRDSVAYYLARIAGHLGVARFQNLMIQEMSRVIEKWNTGRFSVSMERDASQSPVPRGGSGNMMVMRQDEPLSMDNTDYIAHESSDVTAKMKVLASTICKALNAPKQELAVVKTLLSISSRGEVSKEYNKDALIFASNESWFLNSLGACAEVAKKLPVYRFDREYCTFFTTFMRDLCLEVKNRETVGPMMWRSKILDELGVMATMQAKTLPTPSEYTIFQLAFAQSDAENFITAVEIALMMRGKLANAQQLAMVQICRMSSSLIRDDFRNAHVSVQVMDGWPLRVPAEFKAEQFKRLGSLN